MVALKAEGRSLRAIAAAVQAGGKATRASPTSCALYRPLESMASNPGCCAACGFAGDVHEHVMDWTSPIGPAVVAAAICLEGGRGDADANHVGRYRRDRAPNRGRTALRIDPISRGGACLRRLGRSEGQRAACVLPIDHIAALSDHGQRTQI